MSKESRPFLLAFAGMFLSACAFSPKFAGPQYDASTKSLTVDPESGVVLALTNAKLYGRKRSGFDSKSRRIYQDLEKYEGYIGGTVRVEIFGDEVWTMTVWENEAALDRFVKSTQHQDAVYKTNDAMKKFRHLRIKVRAKEMPYRWEQAQKLLESVEFKDHKPF